MGTELLAYVFRTNKEFDVIKSKLSVTDVMLNNWHEVLEPKKINRQKIAYHVVANGKHHNSIRHSRLLYPYTV